MTRAIVVLVVLALVAGVFVPPSLSDPPPVKGRNLLMQLKLGHSQKVLEGLAIRNFDMIERNADELILLSKKAEWQLLQTPDFVRHSDEFRRNADTIVKAAKDKNLDGAALGYVQLTMSCVNCHKHVREVKMAFLDPR